MHRGVTQRGMTGGCSAAFVVLGALALTVACAGTVLGAGYSVGRIARDDVSVTYDKGMDAGMIVVSGVDKYFDDGCTAVYLRTRRGSNSLMERDQDGGYRWGVAINLFPVTIRIEGKSRNSLVYREIVLQRSDVSGYAVPGAGSSGNSGGGYPAPAPATSASRARESRNIVILNVYACYGNATYPASFRMRLDDDNNGDSVTKSDCKKGETNADLCCGWAGCTLRAHTMYHYAAFRVEDGHKVTITATCGAGGYDAYTKSITVDVRPKANMGSMSVFFEAMTGYIYCTD